MHRRLNNLHSCFPVVSGNPTSRLLFVLAISTLAIVSAALIPRVSSSSPLSKPATSAHKSGATSTGLRAFRTPRQGSSIGSSLTNAILNPVPLTTPAASTLSPSNKSITYTGGPFLVPTNASDNAAGPVDCDQAANPCEDFALTIDVSQDYKTTHPADVVQVEVTWSDPSGGQDLDIFLVDSPDDRTYPAHGANGGGNPEVFSVPLSSIPAGSSNYFVRAVPFISTGQGYTGKISLISPPEPTPTPTPFSGIAPRYYSYSPGAGIGENAGEPTVGFNLSSHKGMFISGLQTLRITFPEDLAPAGSVPGACDAQWEDVSYVLTSKKSLDPILYTDQRTGRTFVSQLNSVVPPASPVLIGLNSLMAYTDDDGNSWTPAQLNPPDGSYDHQSIGAGPYPASLPLGNDINKGSAVYYCSQIGVNALCSRSDTGGLTFNRSVPIFGLTEGCGGIHGHPRVAPDGTVYVPVRGCNGVQAVSVSEDAGTTWTVRKVQGQGFSAKAAPGILDPTVGIATDGTLYFAYISGETDGGHAHVAVSHDKGLTWINDKDIGAPQGIHNAVFANAIAGDPDRAAVAFVGSTASGDHQSNDFRGTWYVFMAHTYDGGNNWVTVNATPGNPVQREAGIWNQGGSSPLRNLLDFNGITMDNKGRVIYSYADGCIGDCESGPPNSFSAKATITHQSGGKGLFAQFDPVEPVAPQRPCLNGRRDDMASFLRWRVPDNGGSAITSYKIYRGTSANNMVQIGQTEGGKTSFSDRTADPSVTSYSYKISAANGNGEGQPSNTTALIVGPRVEPTGACMLPGVQVLVDPTGDASDTQAAHDITSVSISEPQALTGKVVFSIKVANLSSIPPGGRWAVRFGAPQPPPDNAIIGPQEDWFVSMVTSDGAAPTFTYGSTGVFQDATRVFSTIGNLDPASNASADGTITLVLPKSAIGDPQPGQAITSVFGSVRLTVPSALPGTGGTNETIPDSTGTGSYALRPANLCLPNTAPLALLTADVSEGVQPLTVHFDGSASSDADSIDTIASYTFNFGEGNDDVTQNSPTISHAFTERGEYVVRLVVTDSRGRVSSNTAQFKVDVEESEPSPTPTPTPAPTPTIIEDNDSRVAYSSGWHLVNSSNASAGHFRYHTGNGSGHFASLDFNVPTGNTGAITYSFAKSPKGGAADVYLDGVLNQSINYAGSAGSTQAPEFKPEYKVQLTGVAAGAHKLEIRNLSGVVYLDRFALENSASSAQPTSGPGSTSNQSGSASAGQTTSNNYQPPSGSQELAISAESSLNVPFKLVLVDPSGLTLQTADSQAGIATVSKPVMPGGVYVIKVVNLSLGPLQFTTTITPTLRR
ncbi:MAG: PKD domain-containing protein [Pyrinomonadaceae bacterium]